MEHKVGDKFIIEIGGVDDCAYPYNMVGENGDYVEYFSDEQLDQLERYEEPTPVVWRNGAVEQWNPMCTSDMLKGFYYIKKDNCNRATRWSCNIHHEWKWKEMLWLTAEEFPMPQMPEPVIEPCPFCGEKCHVESLGENNDGEDVFCVTCDDEDCRYYGATKLTERQAIEAHNAISRKVRGE